eukprot:TRINITY_DN43962_c0_g1_i1.p1 TRINITY_DN43962_c0_g1~~TRINITY_DN43962_c0_g1_i1.p1  ORF type:complete len:562 (+),score=69.96 TRINITY_DN43962_c0_g1_i1:128-1813(+)
MSPQRSAAGVSSMQGGYGSLAVQHLHAQESRRQIGTRGAGKPEMKSLRFSNPPACSGARNSACPAFGTPSSPRGTSPSKWMPSNGNTENLRGLPPGKIVESFRKGAAVAAATVAEADANRVQIEALAERHAFSSAKSLGVEVDDPSIDPCGVDGVDYHPWRTGVTTRTSEQGASRLFPCHLVTPHFVSGPSVPTVVPADAERTALRYSTTSLVGGFGPLIQSLSNARQGGPALARVGPPPLGSRSASPSRRAISPRRATEGPNTRGNLAEAITAAGGSLPDVFSPRLKRLLADSQGLASPRCTSPYRQLRGESSKPADSPGTISPRSPTRMLRGESSKVPSWNFSFDARMLSSRSGSFCMAKAITDRAPVSGCTSDGGDGSEATVAAHGASFAASTGEAKGLRRSKRGESINTASVEAISRRSDAGGGGIVVAGSGRSGDDIPTSARGSKGTDSFRKNKSQIALSIGAVNSDGASTIGDHGDDVRSDVTTSDANMLASSISATTVSGGASRGGDGGASKRLSLLRSRLEKSFLGSEDDESASVLRTNHRIVSQRKSSSRVG